MAHLAGLVSVPAAKRLLMGMTDRFWRSDDASRIARNWRHELHFPDAISGFRPFDRLLLRFGAWLSTAFPFPVVDAIRTRLRNECGTVIGSSEDPELQDQLISYFETPTRINLNQLGEAVLGEAEATRRLERIQYLLERPDVDYVSVKLSSVYSQINLTAWDTTLDEAKKRLRSLYQVAQVNRKFLNLDMEEYRDLELTTTAFREVLDEPDFLSLSAGIVLQSYLPDSIRVQRELTEWARDRRAHGGARIKIRLVKGANLAMERVEAEWHGWSQAPYTRKLDTDAAFKHMLEFACQPGNASAVRIGVGSHNLFDISLALTLARDAKVTEAVDFEMLEGMAPPQARALLEEAGNLLLYSPIVHRGDFGSALAYLVRRLDENTAPGNFLSDLFTMSPNSESWKSQKRQFLRAWKLRDRVSEESRRNLPRRHVTAGFHNQPDTDWTRPENRKRLQLAPVQFNPEHTPAPLSSEGVQEALTLARSAQPGWEALSPRERATVLSRCAAIMEEERFDTLAVLNHEAKKSIGEADAEISEAVDFARYYASCSAPPEGTIANALGTVVVSPPWNFPYAIPCGGTLAALVAGNSVLLKPSQRTEGIGWRLAQQLWQAGVPRDVLQCVLCEDEEAGQTLMTDPRTDAVVLTGSWDTAQTFREWRPDMRLYAETSGINSIIVSAMADRELAARDIVQSAFSHSGQKCSAASLAILEAEVYDDPVFRRQLWDAAASLPVGPATRKKSTVTPLVQKPTEDLILALTTLEDREEWLLQPTVNPGDPCLWSPGIKTHVEPGSWFHQTECFGPILGLMRAKDLKEALSFQNASAFGLTAGFHSLDQKEIEWWENHAEAGNLYVNRAITGAIVQRQPFGGWKRSSIGPGAKAGGPNYVNQFRRCLDQADLTLKTAEEDYPIAWDSYFTIAHDPSNLRCERNDFRYRPCRGVILRLRESDLRSEHLAKLASRVSGVPLTLSIASEEPDEAFAKRLPKLARNAHFLRTTSGSPGDLILRTAAASDLNWIDAPVSASGWIEFTHWTLEQTVSETRHRYGNLLN